MLLKSLISVPFKLEKGKSYYLGELVAHALNLKTTSGLSPRSGYFVVANSLEDDHQKISELYTKTDEPVFVNISEKIVAARIFLQRTVTSYLSDL